MQEGQCGTVANEGKSVASDCTELDLLYLDVSGKCLLPVTLHTQLRRQLHVAGAKHIKKGGIVFLRE